MNGKKFAAVLLLTLACTVLPALAGEGTGSANPAKDYFTDVVLVNQDGEEMRLYSDLLQGKVVVIDTMFTTCSSVCPMTAKTYQGIQDWMGERLGKDAHLISITVDPENDTPEKLRAYALGLGARPGWYFLTGKKENVEFALKKLGQFVESKEAHSTVFLVGNEPTGLWKKAMGLADIQQLLPIVDSVLNDTGEPVEGVAAAGR